MRLLTAAICLSLTSLLVQAADPREFKDHRALNPDATLSVRNLAGLIEVDAWDKAEFDLMAFLGESAEKVEITGDASALRVEVKNRKSDRYFGDGETRLKLRVPAGVALSVDGTSSDIAITGIKGAIVARSVSGDVDVRVPARQITVQSVSGDVQLEAPGAREVKLNTVSGDVNISGASGRLAAESVSGDVVVDGGTFSVLELKSVSGDIGVSAGFATDAKVKAESLSGDVHVRAPSSLSAEVSLKTFSGDKNCRFEAVHQSSDSKRMVLKIGDGRGQMSLTSFSGDITLEKR
jgi:DUF4097 and DUF4098 domain-containing protein YvlB